MTKDPSTIAGELSELEREWITGWQGVAGAAFNCVATDLVAKKLLRGPLDWRLSPLGAQVKAQLEKTNG